MKVKLWINDDEEPDEIDISTNEINAFIELLSKVDIIDEYGDMFDYTGISYDAGCNCFALEFTKKE